MATKEYKTVLVEKLVRNMDYSQAEDYLAAKGAQIKLQDREGGYDQGIKQFIDDKTYKPGLGPMARVNKAS
jgi:trans-feruloyl-CoA hydratase/vanillin synthase